MHASRAAASTIIVILTWSGLCAAQPTTIPVGLDAFRQWDRWPYQRIGARAYMRSTYDRAGRNETADASHFLYQEREDFNVTLDVEGSGVLAFVRTNHWHGSPWHYEIDGRDTIVQETSTTNPDKPIEGSTFIPPEVFPRPLAWTWSDTKGADLMWVPMGFEKRLRLAYSRTFYGTGYYIYHQYLEDAPLSAPIKSFAFDPPDPAVLKLLDRAGQDIAPADLQKKLTMAVLKEGATTQLFHLEGPGMVRVLKLTLSRDDALNLSNARLRITWDDRSKPSVDAPLALFFGAGVFYNRDDREFLVKSFPMTVRYDEKTVQLACYFPMPFFKSATIEIADAPIDANVDAELRVAPFTDLPAQVGYFHATYRDHGEPRRGHDLVLLDTRGAESSQDWSGSFVGTTFIFTDRCKLGTLEGDPRFFFDDAQSPQAYGTGTEEWGGGGDYWGGRTMSLPFAGHPTGAVKLEEAKSPEDQIHCAYRFLLSDLFPFGKNARIQLEHGGENESTEHYRTVTYWYGLPAASLVRTDTFRIDESEAEHRYVSLNATGPSTISSRYEVGPDASAELQERKVRYTTGESEFTLRLEPNNHGVLLRRTLDYSRANQRAEVFIADASDATAEPKWERAGVWYLAGSNTCYHSFPKTELGASAPKVQTSNRRFREDEFLVARRLTAGRSAIRVRVRFTPVDRSLLPNTPAQKSEWSEIDYAAYCWVTPAFEMK